METRTMNKHSVVEKKPKRQGGRTVTGRLVRRKQSYGIDGKLRGHVKNRLLQNQSDEQVQLYQAKCEVKKKLRMGEERGEERE